MTTERGPRRRGALSLVLAGYASALAVLLLLPTSDPATAGVALGRECLLRVGVPGDLLTSSRAEVLANVAVFVPPMALTLTLWPRVRWQDCVAYGFLASVSVEAVQALLFAGRSATMRDVVANTAGATLGALVGVWLRRLRQRRSQRR